MTHLPQLRAELVSIDLFDVGTSPVENGAAFACSWTGPNAGQLIVRGGVLHINAGEDSVSIPRERLQGWTIRPRSDGFLLTLGRGSGMRVVLPASLVPSVERALEQLQQP